MEPIYIPHLLKAPKQTQVIEIQDFIPELETLTPVKGQMRVTHHGNYLEVAAKAEAIATLTCHRCLQQYNHRLVVKTSELIWLDPAANEPYTGAIEREIALEELTEMLPPDGCFDPGEWLYQQMCLAIPLRQLCDSQCQGIELNQSQDLETTIDRRWASLEAIKKKFPS
jgi:uncharacterized protein